jgi:hypothetical protein
MPDAPSLTVHRSVADAPPFEPFVKVCDTEQTEEVEPEREQPLGLLVNSHR